MTPTPISRIRKDYNESLLSDIDVSGLSIALPGTGNDLVYSELRRAEDEFERGDFSPGDEATVNAALVNLITVLSMLLKMRGCVHHDRTNYSILSGARSRTAKDGEETRRTRILVGSTTGSYPVYKYGRKSKSGVGVAQHMQRLERVDFDREDVVHHWSPKRKLQH